MSDFLFAVPKFLTGAVRVIDFGGFFDRYNTSPAPKIADERASKADWHAVANDLYSAACLVAAEESGKEAQEPEPVAAE